MRISVVTISYNQARFLRECIESVLSQNVPDIEYIIVDPGSTDGSREIIDSFGDRVTRVYEKDTGPTDGLNNGFARASGDVFYFINSDDFVLPNSFEKIVRQFETDPAIDVVLAGGIRVNDRGSPECAFYPSKVSAKAYVNGAVTLFQQGMFFKASLFRSVGGFSNENRSCWDGELLLAFILRGAKFTRVMEKIAAFRIYPESITGSQRFSAWLEADRRRMYEIVYGNNNEPFMFNNIYYRAMKFICDPVYAYKRIVGNRR